MTGPSASVAGPSAGKWALVDVAHNDTRGSALRLSEKRIRQATARASSVSETSDHSSQDRVRALEQQLRAAELLLQLKDRELAIKDRELATLDPQESHPGQNTPSLYLGVNAQARYMVVCARACLGLCLCRLLQDQ